MTYNYRERMVGLFVFFAFLLLLFFVLISIKNQHLFENRVLFNIELNSSEGIIRGSSVQALGTEIGKVSHLELTQEQKIRVTIEIYENHRNFIRTGAKAQINRLTNIGNAPIEIKSVSIDAPLLPAGATIPVEETPSMNDMLLSLASLIQSAEKNDLLGKLEILMPKLEQTLTNVHEIIAQIASGEGTLGAAVFDRQVEQDLKIISHSGATILTDAKGLIGIAKQRLDQTEPVLLDAAHLTHDLRGVTQQIPHLLSELEKTLSSTRTALTLINHELADLPGIGSDATRTMKKAEQLLESVQQTWPLSSQIRQRSLPQLIPPHPTHD